MANTTITEVAPAVATYYDKLLLARAVPELLHARFGQQRPIKLRSGNQIKFRKFDALAVATTPLTEGATPGGKQLAVTDVTATLKQYGDFVTLTDLVQLVNQDPVLNEAGNVLGEQAGETIDEIVRDIMVAGTNVLYSTGAARASVAAALDTGLLQQAIRALRRQNAKLVKEQLNASKGVGTSPIRRAFIGICHPDAIPTLEGFTGFFPVAEYAQQGDMMEGEIGSFKEIRFVASTKAKVFADSGASGATTMISTTGTLADVYTLLVIAKDAYGVVPLAGNAMKNIIKPLGSAGSADPLDQRGTSGWKATTTAKLLNDNWLVRIEHACVDDIS